MQSADEPPRRRGRGPLGPPGRRAAERAAQEAETVRRTRPPEAGEPHRDPHDETPDPRTFPTPAPGDPQAPTAPIDPPPRRTTAPHKVVQRVRRVTQAKGMGETGLYKLLEMNAFNAAGDAAMAIGLAGTMFFAVPSGEARGKIALTLMMTMLPFAIVAPLIGPFLDRFRHARRWTIGSTLAIRGFFCWLLADAVVSNSIWLYPLALGCLVLGRAHGIARASAMPRMLPKGMELVTANSRIYASGMVGTAVAGVVGGGVSLFGAEWALRFAFLVYVIGTVLAIKLPAAVDSEDTSQQTAGVGLGGMLRGDRGLRTVPPSVVLALRANAAFRALTGFLIIYMAFLLREQPLPGIPIELQIGVIAGAAAGGNVVGTALGAFAEARKPTVVLQFLLGLAIAVAAGSALFYNLVAVAAIGLVAGFAQQLGKLSLDALIQHEVPEQVRNSVFSRSETVLQLAWVLGGLVAIVMPLIPQLGLASCAIGLLGAGVVVLRARK